MRSNAAMFDMIYANRETETTLRGYRLRVRKVNEKAVASQAASARRIVVQHGGGVANRYGYPAATEAVVAVPVGNAVVLFASRLPANKVTHSGAIAAAVSSRFRAIFDGRYGEAKRAQARTALYDLAGSIALKDAR